MECFAASAESSFGFSAKGDFPIGMSVLTVDDDKAYLKTLATMLRSCSYRVTTCDSPWDAVELLLKSKESYDIVITDIRMPQMDGFQLLVLVHLKCKLPVILMSAEGETSLVKKGVALGAYEFLTKPLRMLELQNIWQHVFKKRIQKVGLVSKGNMPASVALIGECEVEFSKKRKTMMDKPDADPSLCAKKARMAWTDELDEKFVNSIKAIGVDNAVPKMIVKLMNVPGLRREQVASHLQKYRLDEKKSANRHKGCPPVRVHQQQPLPSTTIPHQEMPIRAFDDMILHNDGRGQPAPAQAEGEVLFNQALQPCSSSASAAEDQSLTLNCSIDAGSSLENFTSSDASQGASPDDVLPAGWQQDVSCSRSIEDEDFDFSECDLWEDLSELSSMTLTYSFDAGSSQEHLTSRDASQVTCQDEVLQAGGLPDEFWWMSSDDQDIDCPEYGQWEHMPKLFFLDDEDLL